MRGFIVAGLAALAIHALVLLFGGVFFFTDEEAAARVPAREVELFSEAHAEEQKPKDERKPEEQQKRDVEEVKSPDEKPPDMREIVDAAPEPEDASPTDAVARLEALSLSALESALDPGAGGGGEFSSGVSLSSGGRIGGTGSAGAGGGGDDLSGAFDVTELDQRARPIFQSAPAYPFELREKKVEGTVYMLFVVDKDGRVVNPKVEKSTHAAFERPALDAVRQWKFEPAVRGGEKVPSKVRVPIRFALSG